MTTVCIASIQANLSGNREHNVSALTALVRQAHQRGAQIVVLPELFDGPYFPCRQNELGFARAETATESLSVRHFANLAAELELVIPISFFERSGPHYYNSVAIADADGSILGIVRKTHIPDGPGYQEKFYFRPGDGPIRAWSTRYATIGVGICWDQWFPEVARALVLDGADILLYPTAIGSEPQAPLLDTQKRWQRAMTGHAVSNTCVVACANRHGVEDAQVFYGSSFIVDEAGEVLAQLPRDQDGVIVATVDLAALVRERASWGFFRDRRPRLYTRLTSAENQTKQTDKQGLPYER